MSHNWGGMNASYTWGFTNNRLNGMGYDAAGNLTDAGGGWTFTYDATGQQASSAAYNLQQFYDGDRLRGKKTENGVATYYLRSSVLGGQVVAEMNGSGVSQRGYVYLGGQTVAVQQQNAVYWIHEDPVAKSKRVTDSTGAVVSIVELDPWGGETNRSSNEAFQPKKFTTYERDVNGSDEAMHRRYNRWWTRFEQPDPYDGSYSLADPQSFNRYSYTQNDPVNFTDPSGLDPCKDVDGNVIDCGPAEVDIIPTQIWEPSGNDLPRLRDVLVFRPRLGPTGETGNGPVVLLPGPVPQPHPSPQSNAQQKEFDDCIAPAMKQYWDNFPSAAGKSIVGAAGTRAGLVVFKGGPAVGFGWSAAGQTLRAGPLTRSSLFFAISEIHHGAAISLPGQVLSGQLMSNGLHDLIGNRRGLEAAVAECAKKWPNANHSIGF